ncbi:MAG: hypothetical protein N4A49_11360 [Marinifilaceae bacterium]|jgi:hypothetical protein|nr:hypothetical protein [Marinifilaceae bacterium]
MQNQEKDNNSQIQCNEINPTKIEDLINQNTNIYTLAEKETPITSKRRNGIHNIAQSDLKYEYNLEDFISSGHLEALKDVCKRYNLIIAIRQTGRYSVERIKQAAMAKPHSILEKTIKDSSINKFYSSEKTLKKPSFKNLELTPEINTVNTDNLSGHFQTNGNLMSLRNNNKPSIKLTKATIYKPTTNEPTTNKSKTNESTIERFERLTKIDFDKICGFVGHWSKEGELLGLRTNEEHKDEIKKLLSIEPKPIENNPSGNYIPIEELRKFTKENLESNARFFYTGDYDLHEIYQHNTALPEASDKKKAILNYLNSYIAKTDTNRKGKFKVIKKSITIDNKTVPCDLLVLEVGSYYAMFQHGDQAGYILNQIHEARINKDYTDDQKAKLVEAVAQESDEPILWISNIPDCMCLVSKNKEGHMYVRYIYKIQSTSFWSDENQKKLRKGKLLATNLG